VKGPRRPAEAEGRRQTGRGRGGARHLGIFHRPARAQGMRYKYKVKQLRPQPAGGCGLRVIAALHEVASWPPAVLCTREGVAVAWLEGAGCGVCMRTHTSPSWKARLPPCTRVCSGAQGEVCAACAVYVSAHIPTPNCVVDVSGAEQVEEKATSTLQPDI
jgi:hypothetical protein